jgi:hypothetical protein
LVGRAGKRAIVGGSILLVGTLMLLVGLFLAWYSITESGSTISDTISFSPDGQVSVNGGGISASASYATAHLNTTGGLYTIVEGLLVVGVLVAGIGGALAVATVWRPGLRTAAVVLGAVALVFAIAGPIVLLVDQPAALNSDFTSQNGYGAFGGGSASGVSSPTNSFIGSASANGNSLAWGPTIGWYLAIVAGALCLVGAIVTLTARPSLDPEGYAPPAHDVAGVPSEVPNPFAPAATGDEPSSPGYVCSTCQIRFSAVSDFQAHVRNVHGMESVNR